MIRFALYLSIPVLIFVVASGFAQAALAAIGG